jgi:CheY-like chemotaxis protein
MEQLRILVADDNRDFAEALAVLVRTRGHAVREAYDGEKALALCLEFHPHVLVLDIAMPRLDGYEVSERVRRLEWTRDVLIVALTGRAEFLDRARSHASGFDYHVTKPIALDEVIRLIERSNERLHHVAKLVRSCAKGDRALADDALDRNGCRSTPTRATGDAPVPRRVPSA